MSEATGVLPSNLVVAVSHAVSAFGATVKPRLSSPVGEPEDQMRGPLEVLLASVAEVVGVRFTMMGEASLSDLKVRPDYACQVNGAISGYVEVKAPGKGADPTRFKISTHDGKQWTKLAALPNVIYTDGESWGLYRTGERVGDVVRLDGDIRVAGAKLTDPGDGLARLLYDFLHWEPIAPRNVTQLVATVAPLTRLLRDEVADTLSREKGDGPFTHLASDWRELLFPDATDAEFADEYAQAVTFALLLARSDGIDFTGKSIASIAAALGRQHSLMGKALGVLTDETIGALTVTLDTLVRVISVVDFTTFPKHETRAYATLYESFLETYDNELRKQSGSYYTPAPVVAAMAGLTDQVLRRRLGAKDGFASPQVTVLDPAAGTGQYPVEVLELIAAVIQYQQGPGAVPARLSQAAERVIGIEKQAGPYAVSEMRVAELLKRHGADEPKGGLRLYVADSLDDPFAEVSRLAATLEPIARSRRLANEVKAETPVMVVIGNPPYRELARGHGGFIEHGAPNTEWSEPLIDAFREPGNGRFEDKLANQYVYFWRLATWKVFDAVEAAEGIVCFITTSGYLKGPGFAGMRRYLRVHCSEGWVIDATPEGHQPDVATRIFPKVQQPIAIGLFVRTMDSDPSTPARIHYRTVTGRRPDKFDQLKRADIDDGEWEDCASDWTAPLMPLGADEWEASPLLGDLMPWQCPGILPSRTWVYAPLPSTLIERWNTVVNAPADEKAALFGWSRDANLDKKKPGLAGFPHASIPFSEEFGPCPPPVPIAYRSFDRQWLIPDDRLIHGPSPSMWRVRGDHQTYVTEQHSQHLKPGGPALTFAGDPPDWDHYKGNGGGRVLPLYASADTSRPNVAPGLLELLSTRLGLPVDAADLLAFIAAITAQPAFTDRFIEDLRVPGVRVPLTTDPVTWADVVELGRRVLWLHSRGERFVDAAADRPIGPPQVLDPRRRPLVRTAIPSSPIADELAFDPETLELRVGDGVIGPVEPRVSAYEVCGMNVIAKWFSYRRATRPKPGKSQTPLADVRPDTWPSEYTTDLLDLLHVLTLVTDLEATQAELLERVMAGPRLTVTDLGGAGILPVPDGARTPPKARYEDPVRQLWLLENDSRDPGEDTGG
ncbi:MAG: type ISP restriction/modification enzyme [Actinomycetota bacterium]|nr:type ISP restriction/modification enzyme [Actinomycetota bacterium]